MSGGRRTIVIAAVVLAAVAVTASLAGRSADKATQPAPAIDLAVLGDEASTWRLSDQLGTPVLVNFWASWCTPCRQEMPDIDALVAGSSGSLRAVGVNILDQGDAADAFAQEIAVGYPLVGDEDGGVAQAYGVTAVPYTVIVNAEGLIVARASGRPDAAALEALVADALGPDWRGESP